MRTEQEMMDLILTTAAEDPRIRAVMMNGSRVNANAVKDEFQDYDIVYFVKDISSFTADHSWVDVFGERLIMQMPDQMQLYEQDKTDPDRFAYLMQYKDGNRIDLTLKTDAPEQFDSLSSVLLDKDGRLPVLPDPTDTDYLIKKPSADEIAASANEFWWVSTYVAKGLCRKEIPFAKAAMEGPVRQMLKRMVTWYIGVETDFSVNVGSAGKYFERYLDEEKWTKYTSTYAGADYDENWTALLAMGELFTITGRAVAEAFGYEDPAEPQVFEYLLEMQRKG
ncbi:aminoglycoside 6-adenylyltransferase [Halobacillus salinarum]|uniref:Aminoglycoside 6-adenylyltransferase n=1 Tax=Halobacillus salinarum TaxID=2932257 RepID=A0ABY4EM87_9BACI|nr:aminoglycoside 6-adenylyltransferase [Halobacillus salinarum]UOQ45565.1 aminoglycoside 6-adenylyltransferase [Halobacillus salinarum]